MDLLATDGPGAGRSGPRTSPRAGALLLAVPLAGCAADERARARRGPEEDRFFMQDPIPGWSVGSQDAVEAAREEVQDFDEIVRREDAEIGDVLGSRDEGAAWILTARGGDDTTVSVDAQTGQVGRFGRAS
jgi:hypothetical protein